MPDPHAHGRSRAGGAPAGITTVQHLAEHLAEALAPSSVIVCVGNELCGDDGAGVAVARGLTAPPGQGQPPLPPLPWEVFDTQTVPESFLVKIAQRRPDSVLLIDALDFGAAPGAVELISADSVGGQGPSTHGPAPVAFMEILRMLHPCRCWVLGIQPAQAEVGAGLSPPVERAVEMVVQALRAAAS